MARRQVTEAEYQRLLAWRSGLRKFLRWSEQQAASVGLTGAQHMLLLAVRGHVGARGPTVTDVANYLALQHHSAVGLIDRVHRLGLIERHPDPDDGRVVHISLTPAGEERLDELTAVHVDELGRLAPQLVGIWRELGFVDG